MSATSQSLRALYSLFHFQWHERSSTSGTDLPSKVSAPGRQSISSLDSTATSDAEIEDYDVAFNLEDEKDNLRCIIQSFVTSITGTEANFQSPDTATLEAACVEEMARIGMDLALVQKWFRWACQVANCFYPDHPLDLRVLIVLCNLAIFYIDDVLVTNSSLLYSFQYQLLTQQPQQDPILRCLAAELIPRMWRYFDPAAANAIAVGFYEFIIGTSTENELRDVKLSPSAPNFPGFVRLKSGAPAQYAHWLFYSPTRQNPHDYIQAIPDFLIIINHVNDILSFYKEELAGERDNLVYMRARTSGKSVLDTLAALCTETEERIKRIRETLAPTPETQSVFTAFMVRYIRFHTSTTRYRLRELLG